MSNYQKAIEYQELFMGMKDSLFNEESSKKIAAMQYEVQAEKLGRTRSTRGKAIPKMNSVAG